MKVKITNTHFRYNGKLFKEGSIADLPQSEVEDYPDILIPVADASTVDFVASDIPPKKTNSRKKRNK